MILFARAIAASVFVIFTYGSALAGKVGSEFQINVYTTSYQNDPSVAALTDGGFVVAWGSDGQDGDSVGVYARRYDAAGNPVGGEFRVNKTTASVQYQPSVAGLADGGFIIFWSSNVLDGSSYGIFGQRYDAAGKRTGNREFKVNKTTASAQQFPDVAVLADDGFVVTWSSFDQDGDSYGVYGQRYDAAAKRVGKREFRVNKTTYDYQWKSSVAGLAGGGFVIAWTSAQQDGDGSGVYAQRYDAAGKRVGNREFKVNKTTVEDQADPSVAGTGDGGYVITWESALQDGDNYGIYGQRYNAAGKRVGKREVRVNKTTISQQSDPDVASLVDGGYFIAWLGNGQGGDPVGVHGQRYDVDGKRVGNREIQINTYTPASQENPSIGGLSDGGFVVVWPSLGQDGDSYGVYGQRYGP